MPNIPELLYVFLRAFFNPSVIMWAGVMACIMFIFLLVTGIIRIRNLWNEITVIFRPPRLYAIICILCSLAFSLIGNILCIKLFNKPFTEIDLVEFFSLFLSLGVFLLGAIACQKIVDLWRTIGICCIFLVLFNFVYIQGRYKYRMDAFTTTASDILVPGFVDKGTERVGSVGIRISKEIRKKIMAISDYKVPDVADINLGITSSELAIDKGKQFANDLVCFGFVTSNGHSESKGISEKAKKTDVVYASIMPQLEDNPVEQEYGFSGFVISAKSEEKLISPEYTKSYYTRSFDKGVPDETVIKIALDGFLSVHEKPIHQRRPNFTGISSDHIEDLSAYLANYSVGYLNYKNEHYELATTNFIECMNLLDKVHPAILERTSTNLCAVFHFLGASHYRMALNYRAQEKYDKFEECIKKSENYLNEALKYNKNDKFAYNFLGRTLFERNRGNYTLAIRTIKRSLDIDRNYADAYYSLGIIEQKMMNYKNSKENYEKAIKCDSTFFRAYNNLGILYAKDTTFGDFQKAKWYYERAKQINNDYPFAYYNLACLLISQSKGNQELIDKGLQTILDHKELLDRPISRIGNVNLLEFAVEDPDLELIWNNPKFKEITAKFKKEAP